MQLHNMLCKALCNGNEGNNCVMGTKETTLWKWLAFTCYLHQLLKICWNFMRPIIHKSASQVSVTFPDAIGSLVTCYALATYKSHEHIASTVAYKISFHSSISVLLRHAHDAHPYEVFYSGMHNQGSFQCPLVCLIQHVEGKNEQCTIFCTALDPITQSSISLLIKCELCGGI
jgi:hypothetical protein